VVGRPPLPWCARSRTCSLNSSEPRTMGGGVAGRAVGFAGTDLGALAEGSRALVGVGSVDVSSALPVSVTSSVVDVAVSVVTCSFPVAGSIVITCSVSVRRSIDVTAGETPDFPVSAVGAGSAGPAVAVATETESLTGGSLVNVGAAVAFA